MASETMHETWQERAACRGPHSSVFFPPVTVERREDREERERHAKAICAGCAVLGECRDFALRIREPHGIWGGMTESERRLVLGRA